MNLSCVCGFCTMKNRNDSIFELQLHVPWNFWQYIQNEKGLFEKGWLQINVLVSWFLYDTLETHLISAGIKVIQRQAFRFYLSIYTDRMPVCFIVFAVQQYALNKEFGFITFYYIQMLGTSVPSHTDKMWAFLNHQITGAYSMLLFRFATQAEKASLCNSTGSKKKSIKNTIKLWFF